MAFNHDYELERRYHPENFDPDYDEEELRDDEKRKPTIEVKDYIEVAMKV